MPHKDLREAYLRPNVEPNIDPLLPKEQVQFQHRNSIVCGSRHFIDRKHRGFFCRFVDLTWHITLYGILACCLRLLPDKHMVKMIIEIVQNQSFTLLPVTASKAESAV